MYCPLRPAPRSTIAANFSADGKLLASTQYVESTTELDYVVAGWIWACFYLKVILVIGVLKLSLARFFSAPRIHERFL